jgi:hypothetical protein
MKRVLLLTLCVLIALPSLALAAGSLNACGQAFVFGIFLAPTDGTTLTWTSGCCSLLTGDTIIGDNPVSPSAAGKYCFHLTCLNDVYRSGTQVKGVGSYFNGLFQVCGKLANAVPVNCGPGQNVNIHFAEIDMF